MPSLRVPGEQGGREGGWVQGTGSRSRVPSVCTSSLPPLHVVAVSMEPGRSALRLGAEPESTNWFWWK